MNDTSRLRPPRLILGSLRTIPTLKPPSSVGTNKLSIHANTCCPICDERGTFAFEVRGYSLADCLDCQHRFLDEDLIETHTQQHYGDDYFTDGGAGYTDYIGQGSLVESYGRRYAKVLKPFCPPGKLLDVGSAAGFLMSGFKDQGWDAIGLEPNDNMADEASTRFGFDTIRGAVEDVHISVEFDLATMVQVIAHFRDLRLAVSKIAASVRTGGHVLVETWDFQSLPARVMGHAWHEYSPPTVVNWFSRKSLDNLMLQLGLQRVASGKPRKKISARHAVSLLGHSLLTHAGSQRLATFVHRTPQTLLLPYPSFDVFWALYCKVGE